MKKKNMFLGIVVLFLCIILTGCGSKDSSATNLFNNTLKVKDLSIEDFSWETKSTMISGEKYYAMSLTNNSKYDVIGVEIDYKVSDTTSESDLSAFDGFMKNHSDWIDEDQTSRDITLVGSQNKLIKKGETINQIVLTIGIDDLSWYDVPNDTQFSLMEPKTLQIGIVGKDDKLYIAYYDFIEKSWMIDETVVELNNWTDTELSQQIVKPNCDYYYVSDDDDGYYDFTAYGITSDYFKEYVSLIKEKGFTENDPLSTDSYYSAEDADGNYISIDYTSSTNTLDVRTTAY